MASREKGASVQQQIPMPSPETKHTENKLNASSKSPSVTPLPLSYRSNSSLNSWDPYKVRPSMATDVSAKSPRRLARNFSENLCANGHPFEHTLDINGYVCDICWVAADKRGVYDCRRCDYCVCHTCFDSTRKLWKRTEMTSMRPEKDSKLRRSKISSAKKYIATDETLSLDEDGEKILNKRVVDGTSCIDDVVEKEGDSKGNERISASITTEPVDGGPQRTDDEEAKISCDIGKPFKSMINTVLLMFQVA
eukprot:CAMPEP_0114529372 /NCGR_PEP_ID=MMETSP0109-20121206/24798_1 /TAXON_ID=29199 /ORGANISM="Chlorarachnion reptans, Strain CCCM449" /LENGTH=250 /DNA_ID=CAMNT_0001711767 /DNA_START=29 /DNA_END=781 /DNA_ORIENTATION=-